MKIYIASKAHLPRVRAHKFAIATGLPWCFVCDNDEQAIALRDFCRPYVPTVFATGKPDGLGQDSIAWTREWIEKNLVPENEWYVTLDDNVSHFTWLPDPWYSLDRIDFDLDMDHNMERFEELGDHWRKIYDTPCPPKIVVSIWQETVDKCKQHETIAGGFAIETNFFFRGGKWQHFGYVRTQNAVLKNVGLPFYYWKGNMLEDFTRSVDAVARYGCVVINRFLKPIKPSFEAGGIGTFEERRSNLVAVSDELMRRYPGLLRRNKGQDYQLTFTKRSFKSANEWRREHGYL